MLRPNNQPVVLAPRIVTPGAVTRAAVRTAPPITYTPQNTGVKLWVGEGPPPEALPPGFVVEDQWLDSQSGVIYRLDPGE